MTDFPLDPVTPQMQAAWDSFRAEYPDGYPAPFNDYRRGWTDALSQYPPAALASTPSPAQPTEANELVKLARALFNVRDDEFDTDEWGDLDSVGRERWETYADAALAAGFRIAPSPVQGADDRLAQAEAVIAAAAEVYGSDEYEDSENASVMFGILATYQQSPQAALNEVRAGAKVEAFNEAIEVVNGTMINDGLAGYDAGAEDARARLIAGRLEARRARAAELRVVLQSGGAG